MIYDTQVHAFSIQQCPNSKMPVLSNALAELRQTLAHHNVPPLMVHCQVRESIADFAVDDVRSVPLQVGSLPAFFMFALDVLATALKNDFRTGWVGGLGALRHGRIPWHGIKLRARVFAAF